MLAILETCETPDCANEGDLVSWCEQRERVSDAIRAAIADPDAALLAAFLTNVEGDGTEPVRVTAARALKRIAGRLCRDSGMSFTGLVGRLLNNEANARGWI